MDSAAPSTAILWTRLCQQWSWLINGSAFVLGMFGGCCLLVSIPTVIVMEESGVIGGDTLFESATWKRNQTYSFIIPVRYRMSDDLLANHELVGKTIAEIEELLGSADWRTMPNGQSGYLSYSLRQQWSDEVVLQFEVQNGTVSDVQVVRDDSD